MTERLTANQVSAEIARAKNSSIADAQRATCRAVQLSLRMEANALGYAESLVREHLVPRFENPTDDMEDGYYWCEELPGDHPPCLLRSFRPMEVDPVTGTFSVNLKIPRRWQRWSTSGWVDLTGRVCPIGERPQ